MRQVAVSFGKVEYRVYYKNKVVLCGDRDKRMEILQSPINPVSKNNMFEDLDLPIPQPHSGAISHLRNSTRFAHSFDDNLYTLPHKHQQLKYMRQPSFGPSIQLVDKAVNNNQLQGIPCSNSPKIVNKYLVLPSATSKARLKKQIANVRTI